MLVRLDSGLLRAGAVHYPILDTFRIPGRKAGGNRFPAGPTRSGTEQARQRDGGVSASGRGIVLAGGVEGWMAMTWTAW